MIHAKTKGKDARMMGGKAVGRVKHSQIQTR